METIQLLYNSRKVSECWEIQGGSRKKEKWEINAKRVLTDKATSSQGSAGDRPKSFS